ncbi:MAG TPA: aconitate hydratase [Acidimicrobiales bacterium]|nr:aconitate hydratase [Acidimicrobiales bacterium]
MDSFGSRSKIDVGAQTYDIRRLAALGETSHLTRLPYSIKVLLENLARHEDGRSVTAEDVAALGAWRPEAAGSRELAFSPERVLMQDFTGVPAVVDLAAMRDAMARLGADPGLVNPRVPVELIIDHSVIAERSGSVDAFSYNKTLEADRNAERYRLLRWAQVAFDNFRVVPPDTGICHQVNLEYLARVVMTDGDGVAFPDTLVGTDSHTPMVNGLGVLGWGVGGIEAEAAMLGQPVSMLVPAVVGMRLHGELPAGSTATDLVLTIAELLRRHGVVGKFVEFYGPGVAAVGVENRATIGNMSPEYGATCAIFPVDEATLAYLRFTGRRPEQVGLVEAYTKEQGLFHEPAAEAPLYSETLELDLGNVEPSIAGPARPQDRIPLTIAPTAFRFSLAGLRGAGVATPPPAQDGTTDEASAESFPASDPPAAMAGVTGTGSWPSDRPPAVPAASSDAVPAHPSRPTPARLADGTTGEVDHGAVVVAAITSCTNTSNPQVMVAAGLLARNAAAAGLRPKPWVKTSLAPGSRVVTDYLDRAGLTPALEALGFHLVGYGCTTCIGNSGPLLAGVSDAVRDADLAVCSVLSGNRNFEGRIHPEVRMNYLASPPLVVAYALAGSLDVNLAIDPLGTGSDGRPIHLVDIWPTPAEVDAVITASLSEDMFRSAYSEVFSGDEAWRALEVPSGHSFSWPEDSTYVRRPPFFETIGREPAPVTDIEGARVLALLGDSVTTDHISPAGSIRPDSPAGTYLVGLGVAAGDFNSYGARRGNHEVMIRGTFANVRLRNRLAPDTEGGFTIHVPDGQPCSIYDASVRYATEGVPLVVVAGREYGSGSSRDWAAKGTLLLGVRAVLAQSFERIHRSNLVGMGVLPLEFEPGASAESLGLSGREAYTISGLDPLGRAVVPEAVTVSADGREFPARVRIDTPMEAEYYRHGGILAYVLRDLAGAD